MTARTVTITELLPELTCSRAPITMMPLIALVTLISGVCSAGVTFQITMPADEAGQHEDGEMSGMKDSGATSPDARTTVQQDRAEAPSPPRCRIAFCRGVGRFGLDLVARPPVRRLLRGRRWRGQSSAAGGGQVISPSLTTVVPRMTSSSMSTLSLAVLLRRTGRSAGGAGWWRRAGSPGSASRLGRSVWPRIVTPWRDDHLVRHSVSSQLPPCSAARSTMTLPSFMRLDHGGGDQLRAPVCRESMRGRDDDVDVFRLLREQRSISALMNSSLITLA